MFLYPGGDLLCVENFDKLFDSESSSFKNLTLVGIKKEDESFLSFQLQMYHYEKGKKVVEELTLCSSLYWVCARIPDKMHNN